MSIYDTLNDKQKEAVLYTDGPLLILAGAGSGKTRVLTHRVAYLIDEKGVNPWNILAITFTNKAAGEMRNRVDNLVGFGAESVWVSTFHSMCVRILRRHINLIGYDNNFTIYDTDDTKTLMKDVCKLLKIDTKKFKERALLGKISSAKNEMITADSFLRQAEGDFGLKKYAEVYQEYEKQMHANNALDFDDLLLKTVELFKKCPEVLENYQERFKYIMVDEYQDTNTVQFELVRLLSDKYRNLCVVGDDDQSIYKFRGANIQNILSFEDYYADAKVIKLEQNYRSTSTILNAANAVIRNNKGRKDKTLWTNNGVGDRVNFRQFDNAYDEADYIVRDIRAKVQQGDCACNDNAILYRTNAQSRLFEERFVAANIPYKVIGGVNFYSRREIKDVLAYLKTVDNGKDDIAVKRIINVPRRGIGLTSINRVQDYAQRTERGFYEALQGADLIPDIGRGVGKLESFVALIEHFKTDALDMSILDLTKEILEETGYIESLEAEDVEEAEVRIENIDELLSKIAAYEEDCSDRDEPATLSGFLEEVALVADIDTLNEEQDYVVLMTLHSAKGLEFPRVYLAGMEDGVFPSYMCIMSDDPDELEEERRLCYVGITRAEQELTMTAARRRMIRGETQFNRVSRFLKEVPLDLLSTGDLFSAQQKREERKKQEFQQSYGGGAKARQSLGAKPYSTGFGKGIQKGSAAFGSSIQKGSQVFGNAGNAGNGGNSGKQGLSYGVGDRVSHIKFGEGTVTDIKKGPRDYEVTVEFEKYGVKRLFAAFAKLKKV